MWIDWIIWECEWDTDTVTFLYLYIFIHQTRHEFSDGSVCWNISRVMILIPDGSSVCPPSLCYNARSLNIVLSGFIRSIAMTFSKNTSNVDQSKNMNYTRVLSWTFSFSFVINVTLFNCVVRGHNYCNNLFLFTYTLYSETIHYLIENQNFGIIDIYYILKYSLMPYQCYFKTCRQ